MTGKTKAKFEGMGRDQIRKFIEEQIAKVTKLRFDISSKQIKNHREYRNIKKDIARALTKLRLLTA
ncbi:MAG: 50S ribosomal protein L29 [bacterium]|nr:50S ribosomal protein L29 [bacterium]